MVHEANKKSDEHRYRDLIELSLADMAEFEASRSRDVGPVWDESIYIGRTALDDVEKPAIELSDEDAKKIIACREIRDDKALEDLIDQQACPSPYYRG
jgi:hypothetical protein